MRLCMVDFFLFRYITIFSLYLYLGKRSWSLGCWFGTNPVSCQRKGFKCFCLQLFVDYRVVNLRRKDYNFRFCVDYHNVYLFIITLARLKAVYHP